MAYNSAQIQKDARGFTSPLINTPAEVRAELHRDILDARRKLQELLDIEAEVTRSLWSDLAGVYRVGDVDYITSRDSPKP